jgi:hypothetical protein
LRGNEHRQWIGKQRIDQRAQVVDLLLLVGILGFEIADPFLQRPERIDPTPKE